MRLKGNYDIYQLDDQPLKSGGEGAIYTIANHPDKVAKIYHAEKLSSELEDKLIYMAQNPPDQSIMNQIAWPQDLLRNAMGDFVGFVMPKLSIDTDLMSIYAYPPKIPITCEQKVIIAINICIVISAIHKAGFVFGDFNPLNIGINLKTGHVAFLDTDSYHITDTTSGKVYRCEVCLPGYAAPELIQRCKNSDYANAPLPTFTQETDRFALAVHIFKLLMNGYSPFNGIKDNERSSQASPGIGNAGIERDNYCFKPGNKPQSAATPDIRQFSPNIQSLFKQTFLGGPIDPSKRATADDWYQALCEYKDSLVQCKKNPDHYHYKTCVTCPYCDADQRFQQSMNAAASAYKSHSRASSGQVSFNNPVNVPAGGNQSAQRPQSQAQTQPKTKIKTISIIGRVLLWVFFFPIMVLIKIWKSKKLGIFVKLVLSYATLVACSFLFTITPSAIFAMIKSIPAISDYMAETQIPVNIGKMADSLITGYNNYGYFDASASSQDTVVVDGKEYALTLKSPRMWDGYVYLTLMVDQDGTAIGDATIRAACNEYLSNDDVLTFEEYSVLGNNHSIQLKNNTLRINNLNTEEFVRHDPRDYCQDVKGHSYYYGTLSIIDSKYKIGENTIKLSIIDDKRPGADEVNPGLKFDVYDASGNHIGTGSYLLQDVVYDADYDEYHIPGTGYKTCKITAHFNQAELLEKTGIFFINTERTYSFYN